MGGGSPARAYPLEGDETADDVPLGRGVVDEERAVTRLARELHELEGTLLPHTGITC